MTNKLNYLQKTPLTTPQAKIGNTASKAIPECVLITPDMAVDWLYFNTQNRAPTEGSIFNYKRLIEAGEFQCTHQGIAFSGTPDNPIRLIDGQHRLIAIVDSNTSIYQWVFWGCDDSVYEATDAGRGRSAADRYSLTKDFVAIANSIIRQAVGSLFIPRLRAMDFESVETEFGAIIKSISDYAPTVRARVTTAGVRSAAAVLIKMNPANTQKIKDAYRKLSLAEFEGCPTSVQRLYVRLVEMVGSGGSTMNTLQFRLALRALDPRFFHLQKLQEADSNSVSEVRDFLQKILNISAGDFRLKTLMSARSGKE